MRFVLSSFAILAWAFYELSGGSDFRPPERPVVEDQTQNAKSERPATPARQPAEQTTEQIVFVQPAALVAKPAIEPSKPAQPLTEDKAQDKTEASPDVAKLSQVRSSLTQGLTLLPDSNPETGLSLTSLEAGAAGLQQLPRESATDADAGQASADQATQEIAEQPKDIREVTGTRVNMRDGPGTVYPIVAKLNIGHKLEVLGDSGTGWLRLRVLPEGHLGWISASLVSKAKP